MLFEGILDVGRFYLACVRRRTLTDFITDDINQTTMMHSKVYRMLAQLVMFKSVLLVFSFFVLFCFFFAYLYLLDSKILILWPFLD